MKSKSSNMVALLLFSAFLLMTTAQETRPLVTRPKETRAYTTVLSVDGIGLRCMVPTMVAMEVENSIKRYLLEHPEYLPEDNDFETIDDFDIQLADFFDAMTGVSCGSWVTAYFASKGGNSSAVLSNPRIVRRYGDVLPGQARGLEIFFREYGESFYPDGLTFALMNLAEVTSELPRPSFNLTALATTLTTPGAVRSVLPPIIIPGVTSPVYPVRGLERALDAFFGEMKLSDISTYYVTYAYDLMRRGTVHFVQDTISRRRSTTFISHGMVRDRPREFAETNGDEEVDVGPDINVQDRLDFYIKDVLRGSSATPAFHEAKIMSPIDREEDIIFSLVDGSMVGNNPALKTLILLSSQPTLVPVAEIAMLSLGTGVIEQPLEQNVDAALGWLANNAFLTIMTEGSAENIQAQVDFMFYGNPNVLPGQYLRVQLVVKRDDENGEAFTRATEPRDIPVYKRVGQETARRYSDAIDRFVEDFIFAS